MHPHRLSCKMRLAAMALTLGLGAGSVVAGAGLNEAEALRLGLSRPEFSDLLQARVGEAEADAVAAGIWANPTLELSRDKTGATRETSWQLMQPFDLSGRRSLREDAARPPHPCHRIGQSRAPQ
jgi:autotransporter translocation and assembly factor TamB